MTNETCNELVEKGELPLEARMQREIHRFHGLKEFEVTPELYVTKVFNVTSFEMENQSFCSISALFVMEDAGEDTPPLKAETFEDLKRSWRYRTEHLLALQTLGIKQIVVVQNKVDLITYKEAMSNYSDISKFIKGRQKRFLHNSFF